MLALIWSVESVLLALSREGRVFLGLVYEGEENGL